MEVAGDANVSPCIGPVREGPSGIAPLRFEQGTLVTVGRLLLPNAHIAPLRPKKAFDFRAVRRLAFATFLRRT